MPCDLGVLHAGHNRSCPPRTRGSRCRVDPAGTRYLLSLDRARRTVSAAATRARKPVPRKQEISEGDGACDRCTCMAGWSV